MVENMAAVKYRRTRKFTCLVLNVLIILYNIIYDKENSNWMKGIGRKDLSIN